MDYCPMEIHPGRGIGHIQFGLRESELIELLGPPDKRSYADEGNLRLQYFELRLEFSIEPNNDDRLGWIEVHHPEATLFGQLVIGKSIDYVCDLIETVILEEPESEDYGSFETITYRENWIELQVKFGRVANINFGVLYNQADETLWPIASTTL
jgi:hypothetical protein